MIMEERLRPSVFRLHYLVGTPDGVEYMTELNEFGLFTHAEYLAAFRKAGLKVTYDCKGLIGRGLYIGVRPIKGK